eukprot:SAG11_NODE_3450_length_2441_cov_1.382579_4_plen_122_part_01
MDLKSGRSGGCARVDTTIESPKTNRPPSSADKLFCTVFLLQTPTMAPDAAARVIQKAWLAFQYEPPLSWRDYYDLADAAPLRKTCVSLRHTLVWPPIKSLVRRNFPLTLGAQFKIADGRWNQ